MPYWIPIVFFIIAFSYSTVGFGGGSSYLALLVLADFSYQSIPPMALVCNLVVTASAFRNYFRAGHFEAKKVLPFVIFSIPLAYAGGRILIGQQLFSLLLGIALLAVVVRLVLPQKSMQPVKDVSARHIWALGLPAGAVLGFISGLLGIGGGIFLSPLLLMLRWTDVKGAGACASFFIFLNSAAALFGHLHKGSIEINSLIPLVVAVFLGGQLGSRLGAYEVSSTRLGWVMAGLILCASIKLICGGI